MSAALAVVLAWLLFGGSHLALSSSGLRDRLAAGFGPYGFVIFYTALSVATLVVLGIVQVGVGATGAPGPDLGRHPASGFVLTTVSAVGCFLMIFGFLQFGRSGMAQLSAASRSTVQTADHRVPSATGIFKVSRHPFFMGLGLLMAAHAAMATTLASSVFFAGFAILAAVGTWLLDRKLTFRHGRVYRDYMARTPLLSVPKTDHKSRTLSFRVWRTILGVAAITLLAFVLHSTVWGPTNGGAFALLMAIGGLGAVLAQLRRIVRKPVKPTSTE